MRKSLDFQKTILPHLLVALGFLALSFMYSAPIIEGKRLMQNDVIQHEGASKEARDYREEEGEVSLWTNSMFGGMPAYMIYMDYPWSLTTQLGWIIRDIFPSPANLIFLYLLGFYLMGLLLGFRMWTNILGAIAFAFASYNIINIEAGHISKAVAVAFAPPFMASVIITYRGKILIGSALAALFAALQLYANHVQITYYLIMALVILVLAEFVACLRNGSILGEKSDLRVFMKASGALALAAVLAVGSHTSRLWTTYEYSKQTIRGKSELSSNQQSTSGGLDRDYAFQWSYGQLETLTFLIPNAYGGASGGSLNEDSRTFEVLTRNNVPEGTALNFVSSLPLYWGNQPFTSGPAYLGAIICLLAIFGLFMSSSALRWWLLGISLLFTFLALGKNLGWFNYFVFDYVPLYNKFRAVTMILSVLQLFVVWLAVLGLESLAEQSLDKAKALKSFYYSLGLVGGICLIFFAIGSSFLSFKDTSVVGTQTNKLGEKVEITKHEQMVSQFSQMTGDAGFGNRIAQAIVQDRASLLRQDALRSLVYVLLAGGLIFAFLRYNLDFNYALAGLILLVSLDLLGVARRYLNNDDFEKSSKFEALFDRSPADRKILEDKSLNVRVLNTTRSPFQDAVTSYHHQSVGGYSAVKLRRYQELIDAHLAQNNQAVYNMLNTKYFIFAGQAGDLQAQENPEALGNAWFVKDFKIVKNADEEIAALDDFDPSQIAFVDQRFAEQLKGLNPQPKASDKIKLVKSAPNYLVYESETNSELLAIFSEIYYVNSGKSEWTAYIDGRAVPHLQANYVLRGLRVPAGKHKIEFKFDSPIYKMGIYIDLIASLALFLVLGIALWWGLVQNNEEGSEN